MVLCITNVFLSARMQQERTIYTEKEKHFVCAKEWGQETGSLLVSDNIENVIQFAKNRIMKVAIKNRRIEQLSNRVVHTYWTIPVGEYQVSLQDSMQGGALELIFGRNGKQQVVRIYEEGEYMSPEEMKAVPFEQLLGHNGVYISMRANEWSCYTDYYGIENGELVFLADSWGYERDDYMVDVDRDGDKELVCNVTFLGDGAARTLIYDYNGRQVLMGWGDILLDVEYDNWGTNSTWSQYLPDKNVIRISYAKLEGGTGAKEYALDLKKLEMEVYGE